SAEREEEAESATKRSATELYNQLGAGFVPATDAKKKELGISSGVTVTQVHQGGWFDFQNIRRGQVVTHINDVPVNSSDDVERALGKTERGMIKVTIVPQRGAVSTISGPVDYR